MKSDLPVPTEPILKQIQPPSSLILETKRLILRPFTPNDLQAFWSIHNDEQVNQFLPWFRPNTLAQARELLQRQRLDFTAQNKGYCLAICLKPDSDPIGYVKVEFDGAHDFGYGLKREFWNQHIVTEAAQALIEQLKLDGFWWITATHDILNPASGKVMQHLGMDYKYSYQEQWMPKNIPVVFRLYQLNLDGIERTFQDYWNRYEQHWVETSL